MKRIFLSCFAALILGGCAPTMQEAGWKTVSKADVTYDKAWPIVAKVVGERFDLETVDSQLGYLKTEWKTTDTCWAGLAAGGNVPCKRIRVFAKVEKKPFAIKIKVEKSAGVPLSNYNSWVTEGNDENMEQEILEDLYERFSK